jgi:hypothetical protein
MFELREPLQRFFTEKKSPLAAHFSDEHWVSKLANMCNIFGLLNELNLTLQGRMTTVFKLADKVAAFKAKLDLWGQRVERGVFDIFQTLVGILGETEAGPILSQLVRDHLVALSNEFKCYFPSSKDPRQTNEWIRNPFVNVPNHLSVQKEDQLIEIANNLSGGFLEQNQSGVSRDIRKSAENSSCRSHLANLVEAIAAHHQGNEAEAPAHRLHIVDDPVQRCSTAGESQARESVAQ